MKKVLGILSAFLGFSFVVCVVIGFILKVPVNTVHYKILNSLDIFFTNLPAIIITGFVVDYSAYFGKNYAGSAIKFSQAMLNRYKNVMIVSLICTFLLTICSEAFLMVVRNKKTAIENHPRLVSEYLNTAEQLYAKGMYQRSIIYADAALKLEPNSKIADVIKSKASISLNQQDNADFRDRLTESYNFETLNEVDIDSKSISEVYEYYLKALECYENQDWFKAHYYAQIGIGLATPKDPNLKTLRDISADAWNNITELHKIELSDTQRLFEQKFLGYKALMAQDYLTSYHIFRNLYQTSWQLQTDPEIKFYMDVAEKKLNEKAFFLDETYELGCFESANDVFFSYGYQDGSKDIFYARGITSVKTTGGTIQYLRGFTIESVDEKGDYYRTLTVPYAKVLPVSVEAVNPNTKYYMGITEDIKYVPYIMMKSVSRDDTTVNEPKYVYFDGRTASTPEYLILPISYSDFMLLENADVNPENIPLFDLIKLIKKADTYGFSLESYENTIINRLLYPIFLLGMFVLLASFAWRLRINANQYFKPSWIFAFPFFVLAAMMFYQLMLYLYKLVNFTFVSFAGGLLALILGGAYYVIILIFTSVHLLARTGKE